MAGPKGEALGTKWKSWRPSSIQRSRTFTPFVAYPRRSDPLLFTEIPEARMSCRGLDAPDFNITLEGNLKTSD